MDPSFKFTFSRTAGLTVSENAILLEASEFFKLPVGEGPGKIAGVLLLPDGRRIAFVSGKVGGPSGGTRAGFIPRGSGSGVNRFTVTHIEGHSSAFLHREAMQAMSDTGVGEAALLIPKQPCGACSANLSSMLPKGSRLFVVDPQSTTVFQSVSGSFKGPQFPREPDHFFGGFPRSRMGAASGSGMKRDEALEEPELFSGSGLASSSTSSKQKTKLATCVRS